MAKVSIPVIELDGNKVTEKHVQGYRISLDVTLYAHDGMWVIGYKGKDIGALKAYAIANEKAKEIAEQTFHGVLKQGKYPVLSEESKQRMREIIAE